MNAVDALKDAGFVFCPNVMDVTFDYPLDFWERERDGANILGKLDYVGDGDDCTIVLCPHDEWHTWNIETNNIPDGFIDDFTAVFDRLANKFKEDVRR